MLEKLISFFAHQHLMTNFLVIAVFIGGIFAWNHTSKENLPSVTFDRVRISVSYPGAPAEDVEYFVTKPIEEKLRGLDGVYRITSSSSVSSSSIMVEIEQNYPKLDEAIMEIRSSVLDVDLPDEVIDDPNVRVFKTSRMAIIDVALIHTDYHILDAEGRRELQQYAFALENQLMNLPQINSVDKSGYLREELQIKVDPAQLLKYEIPLNTVMSQIKINHIRKPAGTIESAREPKVTLLSELDSVDKLNNIIIQGGFDGQMIRLQEIAEINQGYEKNTTIYKVNGHEAVMLRIVKNSSYGILEALKAVNQTIKNYQSNTLNETPIKLVLLDDESIELRNRLNLIGINGTIGFILILITLFIFLDKRSGFWVAMGIPFTLCSTMIAATLMDFTINGITLAAVIIVMGMVVDDAIVVAENVARNIQQGMARSNAVVKGTSFVFMPIVSSILTTCIAFVPLFFFEGRFGRFIFFIPPIIFMMLLASLFESVFILPGHLNLDLPFLKKRSSVKGAFNQKVGHWFDNIEDQYARLLEKILPWKYSVFGFFLALLILSGFIVTQKMDFVIFSNEEAQEIVLSGTVPSDFTRYQTAVKTREIEDIVRPYTSKEVVGMRTMIAQSRRGGAVEENKFRSIIEIVPREKRRKSTDQLIKEFDQEIKKLSGFEELKFQKSRWGQDSGSPIEIIVQQNNDQKRHEITTMLQSLMEENSSLMNIEIEEALRVPEYRVRFDREKIKRLSIQPADIASTFRAALEGTVLYDFSNGEEDVRARLTTIDQAKDDIQKVLSLPVENRQNYLVPLRSIVHVDEVESLNVITRQDLKRTAFVYADINPGQKVTPLAAADQLEQEIFPKIIKKYPTTMLSFGGEVRDSRESQQDFRNASIFVLVLIFIVLAVLFNSLTRPLVIMLGIPFGLVGVILAFWLHGKTMFGFYAAIGALGLAGVVINDSIIMLFKLDNDFDSTLGKKCIDSQIANISKTRLRAVLLTTLTTVVGVLPTAYGFAGYDAMLADMMLALTWGMIFGTLITLVFVPCIYSAMKNFKFNFKKDELIDETEDVPEHEAIPEAV